jgi:hypothetical protein
MVLEGGGKRSAALRQGLNPCVEGRVFGGIC